MQRILWGDLETYCEIPITNGTHAYAEGVEVMLFAWAIGDEPVSVWDLTAGEPIPRRLRKAIADPDTLLYFHNSHFDRTVLRHAMPELAPPVERWRTVSPARWGRSAKCWASRRTRRRIKKANR